ncbi:3140_t:CDS:10 [Paraglomus brasilianum]|uniref:3140_t:CDS:1 n=1 Tax=Paraglomus brasilianum TaxID=144538 RepID=A0A9N9CL53_9GLOM|nr:3140_t:CDS:10 [Paraglomus brasilianum]
MIILLGKYVSRIGSELGNVIEEAKAELELEKQVLRASGTAIMSAASSTLEYGSKPRCKHFLAPTRMPMTLMIRTLKSSDETRSLGVALLQLMKEDLERWQVPGGSAIMVINLVEKLKENRGLIKCEPRDGESENINDKNKFTDHEHTKPTMLYKFKSVFRPSLALSTSVRHLATQRPVRLENKTFIITGAASGIGAALARRVVQEGARVVVVDKDEQNGQKITDELNSSATRRAVFFHFDVRNTKDLPKMFEIGDRAFGRVDVLCNNAGVAGQELLTHNFDDYKEVIDTNFTAVIAGTHVGIEYMKDRGGGVIINTGSTVAMFAFPYLPVYTGTKSGVIGFTRTQHHLKKLYNIRVNAIAPHLVETPLIAKMTAINPELRDSIYETSTVPLSDVVNAFIHIVENENLYGDVVRILPNYPLAIAAKVDFDSPMIVLREIAKMGFGDLVVRMKNAVSNRKSE